VRGSRQRNSWSYGDSDRCKGQNVLFLTCRAESRWVAPASKRMRPDVRVYLAQFFLLFASFTFASVHDGCRVTCNVTVPCSSTLRAFRVDHLVDRIFITGIHSHISAQAFYAFGPLWLSAGLPAAGSGLDCLKFDVSYGTRYCKCTTHLLVPSSCADLSSE
jgi:hypothetical protein